jgi:hypothetical protein
MMERMSRIAGNAGIIVSAQQYTNGNKNVVWTSKPSGQKKEDKGHIYIAAGLIYFRAFNRDVAKFSNSTFQCHLRFWRVIWQYTSGTRPAAPSCTVVHAHEHIFMHQHLQLLELMPGWFQHAAVRSESVFSIAVGWLLTPNTSRNDWRYTNILYNSDPCKANGVILYAVYREWTLKSYHRTQKLYNLETSEDKYSLYPIRIYVYSIRIISVND